MAYIAGPPVFREKDYYRDDDRIIEQLIRGQETKTLFIGIRRCGKTSLLKKVNYKFSEYSVFLSLQGTSEFIEKRISSFIESEKRILLLDEFEELKADLRKFSIIKEFLQSHESDRVIIATCSTQIFEPNNGAGDEDNVLTYKQFMRLMEEFETRYIRGLTRDEINALCRQSRDGDISFDLQYGLIEEIIGHLGAFPQPLQYICKELYDQFTSQEDDPVEVRAFVRDHLKAAMEATYSSMRDNYFHHIFGGLTLNEQQFLLRIALQKGSQEKNIRGRFSVEMKRLKNLGVLQQHPVQITLPGFSEWLLDALKGQGNSNIFSIFQISNLCPSHNIWQEEINNPDYIRTYITGFFSEAEEAEPRQGDSQINMAMNAFLNNYNSAEIIIDYGCGKGRLMDGLIALSKSKDKKRRYIGVNHGPFDDAWEYSEKLGLGEYFDIMLYSSQEFEDCSPSIQADFCFLINVLHEIPYNELPRRLFYIMSSLKTGGKLMIHDMCELARPERDFVTWDENDDFLSLFDEEHFEMIFLPLKTARGLPLFTLLLTKKAEGLTMEELYSRIEAIFRKKQKRAIRAIEELEIQQDDSDEALQRYIYHLKLHYNISKQLRLQ